MSKPPRVRRHRCLLSIVAALLSIVLLAAPAAAQSSPPDADAAPDADQDFGFTAGFQLQVSGLFGENVGGLVAPGLRMARDHAVELALYVAGGSHLRTGAELRYRLEATDMLTWWIGSGVAFDVLFAASDALVWSRLTTFSTGLDIALTELIYVGLEFSFIPRVAPLAVTFLERGDDTLQLEPTSDELPFDVADWFLHPGVSVGLRL